MTIKFASRIAALGKINLLMMSIAAAVLGLPAAASAEIVTATFTGTVNSVFDPDGGFPASEATLVATYVFNLANATGRTSCPRPAGFLRTLWFVRHRLGERQWRQRASARLYAGELIGETQVFETGTVLDAVVTGAQATI